MIGTDHSHIGSTLSLYSAYKDKWKYQILLSLCSRALTGFAKNYFLKEHFLTWQCGATMVLAKNQQYNMLMLYQMENTPIRVNINLHGVAWGWGSLLGLLLTFTIFYLICKQDFAQSFHLKHKNRCRNLQYSRFICKHECLLQTQ